MSWLETVPAQHRDPQEEMMVCLVLAGGQSFVLRTFAVREVIAHPTLVLVPLGPRVLAGIVNHRGVMLPVISLRSVLEMEPYEGRSCVVVMRAAAEGGESYGLLVDEMAGVLSLAAGTLQAIPPTVVEKVQDVFRGMYVREQGALVELDAEHLRPAWLMANEHSRC